MAVVDFINTFRIQAPDAIDSRFVLADAQARYDYPLGALYEGLVTYQEDTGILYVLTDIDNKDTDTGWSRVTEDTIVSAETGETKPNGFRDLIFTLTDGTTLTVDDAFRDGVKGDAGATGADGARGEQGQTGLPGIQGQQGLPGTDGINGQDGTNGTDGTDGIDGSQGARGEQGLPGTPGTDGTDGMDGQQGIPGTNGTDGADGQPGKDGAMGNTGPAGSDASVTKTNVDLALEVGDSDNAFYYNNEGEWVVIPDPTKGQIDDAIGASPGTNNPTRFYAEDGQFRTPAGGGGGTPGEVDLFHDITRNGRFLDGDGISLPSGNDATDGIGNTDAQYNEVMYNDVTYYWIQNKQVPIRSAIIRSGNINTGDIVATKNY